MCRGRLFHLNVSAVVVVPYRIAKILFMQVVNNGHNKYVQPTVVRLSIFFL